MRAVNLIPTDQRRGAGGAAGKSGGGAYAVLGGLAVSVAMASAYVLAGGAVDDKKSELDRVTKQAQATESQAQSLSAYTKFTAMRGKRMDTVSQLANSRFDWAHALREVARVLPENAWLTSLAATTSPSVSLSAGSNNLRQALTNPAITVSGCTTSQSSVAKMMARMRLIDGVERVSLSDAAKGESSGGGGSTGGGVSSDCRGGHAKFPQFNMVVFFAAPATPAPPVTGGATASSTTPASTSTPAATAPASTSTSSASGGTTP